MRPVVSVPPSLARRAAAIARGPHACPNCERPTWAEPPVPWVELRDYVVRCDGCERPLSVRVDRDAILRRGAASVHVADMPGMYDAVSELLDRRGVRAFVRRTAVAASVPVLLAVALLALGAGAMATFAVAALAILPASAFAPALAASAWESVRGLTRRRRNPDGRTITIELARWDQWHREEQRHLRECADQPEAVLDELSRVLDDRELRRVRAQVERGEVSGEQLSDLARFRHSWRTVA